MAKVKTNKLYTESPQNKRNRLAAVKRAFAEVAAIPPEKQVAFRKQADKALEFTKKKLDNMSDEEFNQLLKDISPKG